MADFQVFLPEEQNLLAGSLFKVGMWISHIDDEGECAADEKEREVLDRILKKSASYYSAHPVISEMANEAHLRNKNWGSWEADADRALEDVTESIKLLNSRLVDNEVKAYKQAVMRIATSIAGAFDEAEEDKQGGVWGSLSNFVVGVANPKLQEELNTSPAEQEALTELAEILDKKLEKA